MVYEPPHGWIERPSLSDGQRLVEIFHLERNCTRVQSGAEMRITDKPYSARRCVECGS